jgi:hypothetical protein
MWRKIAHSEFKGGRYEHFVIEHIGEHLFLEPSAQ